MRLRDSWSRSSRESIRSVDAPAYIWQTSFDDQGFVLSLAHLLKQMDKTLDIVAASDIFSESGIDTQVNVDDALRAATKPYSLEATKASVEKKVVALEFLAKSSRLSSDGCFGGLKHLTEGMPSKGLPVYNVALLDIMDLATTCGRLDRAQLGAYLLTQNDPAVRAQLALAVEVVEDQGA